MIDHQIFDFKAYVALKSTLEGKQVQELENYFRAGAVNALNTTCNGSDEWAVYLALGAIQFETQLRDYIAGWRNHLGYLLQDTKDWVQKYGKEAIVEAKAIIARMRTHFRKNEWFELMPRFDAAVDRVEPFLQL